MGVFTFILASFFIYYISPVLSRAVSVPVNNLEYWSCPITIFKNENECSTSCPDQCKMRQFYYLTTTVDYQIESKTYACINNALQFADYMYDPDSLTCTCSDNANTRKCPETWMRNFLVSDKESCKNTCHQVVLYVLDGKIKGCAFMNSIYLTMSRSLCSGAMCNCVPDLDTLKKLQKTTVRPDNSQNHPSGSEKNQEPEEQGVPSTTEKDTNSKISTNASLKQEKETGIKDEERTYATADVDSAANQGIVATDNIYPKKEIASTSEQIDIIPRTGDSESNLESAQKIGVNIRSNPSEEQNLEREKVQNQKKEKENPLNTKPTLGNNILYYDDKGKYLQYDPKTGKHEAGSQDEGTHQIEHRNIALSVKNDSSLPDHMLMV